MVAWEFSDKARASIFGADGRLNVWHGAVRSGKTVSSLIAWLRFVRGAPPGALLMAGKTERTLRRNVLALLDEMVGPEGVLFLRSAGELVMFDRRIYLVGANDVRAEERIRGLTLAGAYGDELSLWPESFFKMLLSRLSAPGARFYGTTNPDGPQHWLKRDYLDRAHELDMRAFHFGLEDNPALDPGYVASLRLEYGPGSLWSRRFLEGRWVQAEGAVYDFFDELEHVLPSAPATAPDHWDLACDYGTSNATSVGLYASWRSPPPGQPRCVRLRGYYHSGRESGRQKTDAEYADDLERVFGDVKPRHRWLVLDPSAASFRAELRRRGWRVRDASNAVLDGIRTVAGMMKRGDFRIGPDASNQKLIGDIGNYVWDPRAQARGEDRPLGGEDHTLDELRYYLHTVYGRGGPGYGELRRAAGR